MGSQSIPVNTGRQMTINNDSSQTFIGGTFTRRSEYVNNSSYDDVTIAEGTVMGRITTSGVMVPFKSDASDGSQIPRGAMNNTVLVPAGETLELPIVIMGEVATNKLVFAKVGDSVNTIVTGQGRVQDLLAVIGFKLVDSREMTSFDNS